jgi:uncharacterized lipoprotein YmbA
MMRHISRRFLITLAAPAILAACSSPSPTLYTIAPVPAPPRSGTPKVIMLQQVVLARYLDREQIVRSSENYRLDVMANDWWGESLSAMLSRVLVEELSQRLPHSTVLSENAGISSTPDATIELNIQRMDKDASGNLILQAQTSVAPKGKGTPALRSFRFSVAPPSPDIAGEVAAISTAVGQLADGLTDMLVLVPGTR